MSCSIAEWEVAWTPPGRCADAGGLDALDWRPACVPATTAELAPEVVDHDAVDWWWRAAIDADAPVLLRCEGLATAAEVHAGGVLVATSGSMFTALEVELAGGGPLALCFRALEPLLAQRRAPRARWRTRLVSDGNLRWWRTSLIGRAPGFSPGPPIVGPWRPVTVAPVAGPRLAGLTVHARLDGDDGVVDVAGTAHGTGPLELRVGELTRVVTPGASGAFAARVEVERPARWWPHTHGEPALHDVSLTAGGAELARRRVGFRALRPGARPGHDVLEDGLDLHVNGVRVFARGALWTHVPGADIRPTLERAREGGLNMIRVPGTGVYEDRAFHDACDELGLLVWQDFMFANLDYPVADEGFRADVLREAQEVCGALAGRPSLAVLCGNSEVEQQVAMLGLDPALGRGELFGELLPEAAVAAGLDAVYVPSAPSGNGLPMRPDRGVANYFGVGGYRRPPEDARRAGVRFASECLALANVPVADPPERTTGVQRDVGADWDFADVRDHYLALLHGVDPERLLAEDPARYYDLSRLAGGEVMAGVFGEWRRAGSPSGGGLILWLRDVVAGSGWGLLDSAGTPKPAWHHLRRVLAPLAVWSTDEGLAGIDVHLANDRPEAVRGELRVGLYHDQAMLVGEAARTVEVAPRATVRHNVEELLGRFADAAYAYRFGAPQHDVVLTRFTPEGHASALLDVRLPAGPLLVRTAEELGLTARRTPDGVEVSTGRLAHAVRICAPGHVAADDGFSIEPGGVRSVALIPIPGAATGGPVEVRAANLRGAEVAA